jgi:hypothetical protein
MKTKTRGAPRGNRNALKHGFYSSIFKENERRVLSSIPLTDLSGEIELIRVANFRFLQALNMSQEPLDVETQLAAVRAVNLSAQSITSLIRAQALAALTADDDKLHDFLERPESRESLHDPSTPELPQPEAADDVAE